MVFYNKRRRKLTIFLACTLLLLLVFSVSNGPVQYEEQSSPPPPRAPLHRCFASHQKRVVSFKNKDIINPSFEYIINRENACSDNNVEVIIPVHSAITNSIRRDRTRKFRQGQFADNRHNRVMMLFFVGLPSSKLENPHDFQRQLQNESETHKDIIQINVNDTYRNVVFKAIAVLQWVNTYCNKSEFVLKMDDDILVDPALLLLSLYRYRNFYSEFIVGELRTNRIPERSKSIKWYMPEEEYSNSSYPPFVPGPVLGYPTTTAVLLYQQALRTKTIWLDDIFITGICSQKLGIPVLDDKNFGDVHRPMKTVNFVYQ